jgi:hypothetical protein
MGLYTSKDQKTERHPIAGFFDNQYNMWHISAEKRDKIVLDWMVELTKTYFFEV